ncbi:MAG: VWA domain-containing protein [Candidatus Jettenia sp. CY-1]|nr:MAG: VWA domain-containing protein [Candidatus Jettenia sp. CY-1]
MSFKDKDLPENTGKNVNKETDQSKKTGNIPAKKKKKKKIIIPLILIVITIVIILLLRRDASPILEISPSSLNFGNKETEMEFTIKNVAKAEGFFRPGVKHLEFDIDTRSLPNWIIVEPTTGSVLEKPSKIRVTVDRDNMPYGSTVKELKILTNAESGAVPILVQKDEEKLTLISPSTGTSIFVGDPKTIEWTATAGVSESVNIFLYSNEVNIGTIAENYNFKKEGAAQGSFNWKVDDFIREGNNYAVRIEDANNPKLFDMAGPIKIIRPLRGITVLNQTTDHQFPNTIQFVFSLRDQNNHAILFDSNQVDWKNIKIWENKTEIDYLESHALLYTQDDFQLQVMIVLDFSASMYETNEDIDKMTLSAKDLIDSLNETHQIGVVEFHRPDEPPALLHAFTTYKNTVKKSIDNFSYGKIYRDFSSCWDAVQTGLKQFPEKPDPNIFKTLVFLSDGFDNSSFSTPDNVIALAKERDVHIYVLGIGPGSEEKVLETIALETGGTYVFSENINVLRERFKQIIKDVRGQYKIKYITPKKPEDGRFVVESETTYKGVTATPLLHDEIDPSSIFRKTIEGVIRFSTPSAIEDHQAEIFMWCEHAPRYVNKLRFRIGTDKPCNVVLTSSYDGGLCKDWTLNKETDGWYSLTSPDTTNTRYNLAFGAFGTICKIIVTDIDEEGFKIPFKFDNSIYDIGQAFYEEGNTSQTPDWSTDIIVGNIAR